MRKFKITSKYNDENSVAKLKETKLTKTPKQQRDNTKKEQPYVATTICTGNEARFNTLADAERFMRQEGLSTTDFHVVVTNE